MPVAVLKPDVDVKEDPNVVVEPNTNQDPLLFVDEEDEDQEYDEFLQAIADIEDIIRLLEEDKVKSVDSIKGSLLNIDVIYSYFQKHFPNSDIVSQLKVFLSQEGEKILQLINDKASNEVVLQELEKLLSYVVNAYKKANNPNQDDNSLNPNHNYSDPSFDFQGLKLPKVDALYDKLSDAMEKNDTRKETCYRGRIIRELSKHKDEIHKEYDKVKVLAELGKIIASKSPDALSQIQAILSKSENKKFYDYFSNSLNTLEDFQSKLFSLLQNPAIISTVYYEYALKEETKTQGRKLKDRYSKEFLDQRAGLTSIVTVLPNAVGLSVQKLANTITELQEAKTNRKKVNKFLETLKDTGRVLATPAIYLGKFAINNWYILYKLYGSYQAAKPAVQNQTKVDEKPNKEDEPEKEPDSTQNDAQTNPDTKVDPVKEPEPKEPEPKEPDPVEPNSVEPDPITDPGPVPEPDSVAEPNADTNNDTDTNTDANNRPIAHPDAKPKPHVDKDPGAKVAHDPKLDEQIDADIAAYKDPSAQVDPSPAVDPNAQADPAPQPQPDLAPEPQPDPVKPTPEVNPVTTVDPVATVPDYNPWRWEAVCDPKSDSFIVLPGFLINWMGIRNTVDTMNDMAIYHNYHDYSNGGTTVDSNGYSHGSSGKF